MTKRCVAQGCNSKPKGDVSVHTFPKEPKRQKKWEAFVAARRQDWKCTKHSYLCSLHFIQSDFIDSGVKQSLGYQMTSLYCTTVS